MRNRCNISMVKAKILALFIVKWYVLHLSQTAVVTHLAMVIHDWRLATEAWPNFENQNWPQCAKSFVVFFCVVILTSHTVQKLT